MSSLPNLVSLRKIVVVFAVIVLSTVSLHAAIETASSRVSGSAVVTTATATAIDNKYVYMQANPSTWYTNAFKVANGKGRVRVGVDHGSLAYVANDYDYTFYLKIEYKDTSLGSATTIYRQLRTSYDYDATNAYQDAAMYEVNTAKVIWLKFTIDSIRDNVTSTFGSTAASNMYVEASTEVERYYNLDYVTVPSTATLFYAAPNTTGAGNDSNEVRVAWNYIDGAEEYDLEWTYVNDYSSNGGTLATSAISYDFTHNSTRITTADQHYNIPLIFDRGWLIFRIRAVGRAYYNTTGEWKRVYGKWTTDGVGSSGTVSSINSAHRYQITVGHEKNKNWQYVGTFAEDGKKKEVVSYYDGSLRNRQTVTKTSTDKKVLIGETFYDFQGRAAVTALPAPVAGTDQELKFYDGFNRIDSTGGKTYSRYDFDEDQSSCNATALAMNTGTGASYYYSSSNSETSFQQAWLPDAKKYPFAQVEYMPDNTGRVRKQGGVGPDHQLGSGHETQYYYGQPFQEELDRLFGSEAGYKKHYNKTVTVDANGQASVTYLDQEGRTVATALAGTPPSNLQMLTNASGSPLYQADSLRLTIDLLGKDTTGMTNSDQDDNIISTDGRTLSVNTQLTVVNSQVYGFTYSVTGSNYHGSCMPVDTCYQCVYDLTITVRDQCGNAVSGTPITQTVGGITHQCSAGNASFTLSPSPLNLSLIPGVYTVSKTLSVNQAALDNYTAHYISGSTCVRTEESFVDSALAHIDTSGCHITCTNCADAEYVSPCEASYEMLLADVSPGGQYAEYLVATSPASTQYPLSVLNDAGNLLPMLNADWRHPIINEVADHYYDANMTDTSRIPLITVNASTYTFIPAVQNTSPAHSNLRVVNGVYTIEPQYLDNVNDFISNWKDSWAKSLVDYHPEYRYYKWCIGNASGRGSGADTLSSDEYDSLLLATNTLSAAHAKKLLNPLGNAYASPNQSNCQDPYFRAAGLGSAQYNHITKPDACEYSKNYQASHQSIWKLAKIMNNCGTVYVDSNNVNNCLKTALGVSTLPTNDTAYITTDADWIKFRDLYLSIKQHFQQGTAADTARYWDSYNGCIGNQQYNPGAIGMFNFSSYNSSPFFDDYDTLRKNPCGHLYPLYQSKTKRFPDENDLYPGMADVWANGGTINTTQTDYNNYLQTGQCPNAVDLQGLLNAINTAGHLTASNDSLYKYTAFTQDLYNFMVSSGWHYPIWSGSGSGSTLTGALSGTGVSCGSITLTFPSGSYTWSGLGSTFDIVSFSQLIGTGTYSFTVVATIYDYASGTNVMQLLTGSSGCVDVSCSFSNTCEPTGEAYEVFNLMNLVAAKGTLYTTSSPGDTLTTGNTGSYFNNTQFRSRFNTSAQYWQQQNSNDFMIYAVGVTYPSVLIRFKTALPSSVTSFSDLTVVSGDTLQVKAYNGSYTTMKFVVNWRHTIAGINYDNLNIAMGTCGASTPSACVGDEFQRRDDLNLLLETLSQEVLLKSPTSGGTPLDTCSSFTALLEAPLGFSSYQWKGSYSGNNFTGRIYNNTTSSIAGTVTLAFTSTPGGGKTWDDVRHITGLWADESNLFNGVAYNFTAMAWFNDGTSRTITGTSCYGIRNCSVCTANAGNKYENFETATTGFGSSISYTSSCPGTNQYTITSNDSALCHDNTLVGVDHTQPGTGKFFYTKYNSNGAQTLWKKATSYSARTPYTFSVWYMDASTNADTHVTLELWLGSTQLTSVAVTDNAGVWKKLSVTWNGAATAGTDTLKIKTSGAGAVNSRLGIDDIGFYTDGCDPVVQLSPSPTYPYCDSCRQHLVNISTLNGHAQYAQYIDSVKAAFQANYIKQCMGSAVETFGMLFTEREYHYTLYYYDQAGNLVRTVPPAGVNYVNLATYGQAIKSDRKARTQNPNASKTFYTSHTMATTYTYNSLNQLVRQVTPDGDTTRFWYDVLGRIVASQNAKQKAYSTPRYSYTVYDAQGRIAEVGELATTTSLRTMSNATLQSTLNAWNYPDNWDGAPSTSNYRYQVTKTYYDAMVFASAQARFTSGTQDNLRKRVVSAAIYELYDGTTTKYSSASHYSYDIHGNVKEVIQEDSTLRALDDVTNARYHSYKKMTYFYDLVSGKVNEMWYQDGQADAFYYKYAYDDDNRVTAAYTSKDKRIWDRDAKYFYYLHGPLARTELGQNKVQGEDYAYTLHGWIKGVNSVALMATRDMGRDANTGLNNYVPVDQYGYELTYYDTLTKNDYTSITTNAAFAAQSGSGLASGAPNLWNGNIRNMVTSIAQFATVQEAKAFRYDQLNRIIQAQAYTNYNSAGNSWNSSGALSTWKENFSYDENGNILTLVRHGNAPTAMDSLNYHYTSGTNKLTYVDDGVSSGNYGDDIDDQSSGNYNYDKIGNLVSDVAEQIDTIKWNVYGKIEKVIRTSSSTKSDLEFRYNPMGQRICKIVKPRSGSGLYNQDHWTYTYYMRDASGNVISTYERKFTTPATYYYDQLTLKEENLYGSSRVGVKNDTLRLMYVKYTYVSTSNNIYNGTFSARTSTAASTTSFVHALGRKSYELVNHLGNVLVTVSDMRTANHNPLGGPVITSFNAVVNSATDYYAFGGPMEGRSYTSTSYRYGFNGKEKDNEITNNDGSDYDFGARIYDARLGRWMSVDPLQTKYTSLSPYNYTANNPILFVDYNGKDIFIYYTEEVTQPDGSTVTQSKSYQYGKGLPVPDNQFVQTAVAALDYAAANDPNAVVSTLQSSTNITWNISETTGTDPSVDDATTFAPTADAQQNITHVTANTRWNPNLGQVTSSGGAETPTTILYHEGSHALSIGSSKTITDYKHKFDPVSFDLAKDYDKIDDLTVITQYETPYIQNVNKNEAQAYKNSGGVMGNDKTLQVQGERNNHRGRFYYTNGINSLEPGPGMSPGTCNGGKITPGTNITVEPVPIRDQKGNILKTLPAEDENVSGIPEKR